MNATIAKCENCGAALRIDAAVSTVDCQYCGVTSMVGQASGGPCNAPKLRIEPPPPIDSSAIGAYIMTPVFGGCFVVFVVIAVQASGWDILGFAFAALLFGGTAAVCVYLGFRTKREARELQWFRDNGIPGRATVERISAQGEGRVAKLGLKLELTGQPERHLEHRAVIPQLLIPRLTQGLTLPTIVHPQDPDRIEVQWHLV